MSELPSLPNLGGIGSIQGRFPSELPRIHPDLPAPGVSPNQQPAPSEGPTFGDTLGGLIHNVDDITKSSHEATRRMLTGEVEDVHQVMVAVEEASTSFQLMMEIRNKLVEAYREVMRMQV